jgi:hypothetical protein
MQDIHQIFGTTPGIICNATIAVSAAIHGCHQKLNFGADPVDTLPTPSSENKASKLA